jgi:ribosomal protein S4E
MHTGHTRTLFLDVLTIEKTNEKFRLLYDVKGRFAVHSISPEESQVLWGFFFSSGL